MMVHHGSRCLARLVTVGSAEIPIDMINAVVSVETEALACNDRKRRYKQNAMSVLSRVNGSDSIDIRFNASSEFCIIASSLSWA